MKLGKVLLAVAAVGGLVIAGCSSSTTADQSAGDTPVASAESSANAEDNAANSSEDSTPDAEDSETVTPASGSVKLGFMVPQSGVYASIGEDMTNAANLYLDQHGGQLGGRSVDLVTIDEGSTPQTGTAAANRLLNQDQVDVVTGVVNSATAAAIGATFESSQTPILSLAQLPVGVQNNYWWVTSYPNFETATAIADAIAAAKPNKVALMAADYTQGHAVNDSMIKLLADRGIETVDPIYTPFGDTLDFQPFFAQVQASGAEALHVFYAGSEAVRFVQQFADFGLKDSVQLYSNLALTEGNLEAQGEAAVGLNIASVYSTDIDNPVNTEFVSAYQDAYGKLPTVYAESQYNALIVLDQSLAAIDGDLSGEAINNAIRNLGDISTPRGTWHFDSYEDGGLLLGPVQSIYLLTIENRDGQLVAAIDSDLGTYNTWGKKAS